METMVEAVANVTLGDLAVGGALLLGIVFSCVEVSKIKLNPWTWLGKKIGRAINGELIDKVDDLGKIVDDNEIDRIRWEILDFANSCRNGRKHTYGEFVHIIELNGKYHKILDKRELTNGQIDAEYSYILELFQECQRENKFL